jgi:hypothetical protein
MRFNREIKEPQTPILDDVTIMEHKLTNVGGQNQRKKMMQVSPKVSDDGDGGHSSLPMAEFYPLPPNQASASRFPRDCPVVLVNHDEGGKCSEEFNLMVMGRVLEVGIDFDTRKDIYKVDFEGEERIIREEDLQYAPMAPVWLTLPHAASEIEGKILGHCGKGDKYTVQAHANKDCRSAVYADVSSQWLRFRSPKQEEQLSLMEKAKESSAQHDAAIADANPPVGTVFISSSFESNLSEVPTLGFSPTCSTKTLVSHSACDEQTMPSTIEKSIGALSLQGDLIVETGSTGECTSEGQDRLRRSSGFAPTGALENLQPSPFQKILVTSEHSIRDAFEAFLRSQKCRHICLHFHLEGHCRNSSRCRWAASHRDLTENEAQELEEALRPVSSPLGPILTRTKSVQEAEVCSVQSCDGQHQNPRPNPFHRIDVRKKHNLRRAFEHLRRSQDQEISTSPILGRVCWCYSLLGFCRQGRYCGLACSHKDLSDSDARELERVLAPVMSPNGPIYTVSAASSSKCRRASMPTPQARHPDKSSGCGTPSSDGKRTHEGTVQRERERKKVRYSLPLSPSRALSGLPGELSEDNPMRFLLPWEIFGQTFFHRMLVGEHGHLTKELSEKFHCTLELVGQRGHNSSLPFSVSLVGVRSDSLRDCCKEMERVLAQKLPESTLQGLLLFRLAVMNQHRPVHDNIAHVPYSPDSSSKSGREGLVHMAIVSGTSTTSRDGAMYMRSLERRFPSCRIQAFRSSDIFPKIKPFLLITSQIYEDVSGYREELYGCLRHNSL